VKARPAPKRSDSPPLGRIILWIGLIVVATAFYLQLLPDTDHHSEDLLPQWTLARLAVTGHRADSYSYAEQKKLFDAEIPPLKAEILKSPHVKDIGVSPYPPTMVLLFAPIGFFSYERAAQVVFVFTLSLSLIAAGAIAASTRWRISGFAATALVLVYPGFAYNLLLGQNALVTLSLLALGWCAMVHGKDGLAGIAWGLLAYKPHWWVAIVWLPLLLQRWRVVGSMLVTAAAMAAAATLWLGADSWSAWLDQVQAQDKVAYSNELFRKMILGMACDIRGVINRYMPGSASARLLGWGALAVVGAIGIGLTQQSLRHPNAALDDESASPAWLFTAVMVVPYAYYYDECAILLPLLVLWSQRERLQHWQLGLLAALTLGYYCALPVMMYRDPGWRPPNPLNLPEEIAPRAMAGWLGGPNWALLVALSLWGLSLAAYLWPKRR
jgi:hypothetical protein